VKMDASGSSEAFVSIYQTKRHHITRTHSWSHAVLNLKVQYSRKL